MIAYRLPIDILRPVFWALWDSRNNVGPGNKVEPGNKGGPENKARPKNEVGPGNIVAFTKQVHM